jgi:hypothetical protein
VMSAYFYYLAAAVESVLSVPGIRPPYKELPYTVVGHLATGWTAPLCPTHRRGD